MRYRLQPALVLEARADKNCRASPPCSYFTFVKNPMDLSTVRAKLEDGQYTDRQQVAADIRLIPANAQLYNTEGSHIWASSEKILNYFNKRALPSETFATVLPDADRADHGRADRPLQSGRSSTVRAAGVLPSSLLLLIHRHVLSSDILNQHKQPEPAAAPPPAAAKPAIVLKKTPSISMPPPPLPASVSSSTPGTAAPRPTIKLKPMGPSSASVSPGAPSNGPPKPSNGTSEPANGNGAPKKKSVLVKPPKIKLQAKPAPGEMLDDLLDEELGLMGTPPPPPPQAAPKIKLKPMTSQADTKPPSNGTPTVVPAVAPLKKFKLKPMASVSGERPSPTPPSAANPAAPAPRPIPVIKPPAPTPLASDAAPPPPPPPPVYQQENVDPSQPFRKPEPSIAHVNVSRVETPLNPRRARLIIERLMKFPAAFIVSSSQQPLNSQCISLTDLCLLPGLLSLASVCAAGRSDCRRLPDLLRGDQATDGLWHDARQDRQGPVPQLGRVRGRYGARLPQVRRRRAASASIV